MKIALSNSQVVEALLDHNVLGERHEDKVIEGTCSLVGWLEDLEEDTGEEMELDPVALRCQFSLYTYSEAEEAWCIDTSDAETPEQLKEMITDYLNDNTIVIPVDDNNLIVAEF
tara:strand:- start:257 stop:598 length:342 start_codon:yes stop_codon:yes gene_type:complete